MPQNPQSRAQAWVGLCAMSFASLAFHAVCKNAFTQTPAASPEPPRPDPAGSLDNSKFKAILSSMQALSTSIAQMNTSLHARIDSQSGSCVQLPTPEQEQRNVAVLVCVLFMAMWLVAFVVFVDDLRHVSKGFQMRVLCVAILTANIGLAWAVFGMSDIEWFVYVPCAVWPMYAVMAGQLLLYHPDEVQEVERKAKEKSAE